jgi:hypothetical protein
VWPYRIDLYVLDIAGLVKFKFERWSDNDISNIDIMNIVASSRPLDLCASNMHELFAEIITDLADRIINIETGKCYYVNGIKNNVTDVEPSLSMDLGYCTVNMRVYRSNLIILLPSNLSKHIAMEVIKSLVNAVSIELIKRDSELGTDSYVSDNMYFALTQCEFTPAANSFHTDESNVQMTKRVFLYTNSNRNLNKKRNAAFIWKIKTDFDTPEAYHNISEIIWMSDHANIHVDLANLRIAGLSRAALYDSNVVLAHFGVAPTITYNANRFKYTEMSEPFLLPGAKRKYIVNTFYSENGEGIRIKLMNTSEYLRECRTSLVIDRPDGITLLTQEQFINEFLKDTHDTCINSEHRCQMCLRRQIGPFYVIQKIEESVLSYTPVCRSCIKCDTKFVELSKVYKIFGVEINAPFSTVSRDYGISQTHMELFECRSLSRNNYARDDATFAFLDDIRARGAPIDIITSRYDASCIQEL